MKNLIFVIKLWYLNVTVRSCCGCVHESMWGKRAPGREGREDKRGDAEREREREIRYNILSRSDFKTGELIAWWVKCPKGNEGHKEGAGDERWAGVGACELWVRGLFWSRLQRQKPTRCSVVAAAAVRCGTCTKDSEALGGEKCFVISASSSAASSKNYSLTFIISLFRTCCGGSGMLTAPAFKWDT